MCLRLAIEALPLLVLDEVIVTACRKGVGGTRDSQCKLIKNHVSFDKSPRDHVILPYLDAFDTYMVTSSIPEQNTLGKFVVTRYTTLASMYVVSYFKSAFVLGIRRCTPESPAHNDGRYV